MKLLNDEFDEFRDCLRLTWNLALRRRPNGAAAYDDVAYALLKGLVLDELAQSSDEYVQRNADGYIPGLGLKISAEKPEVRAPQDEDDDTVWNRVDVGSDPSGATFYYVDVFDFKDFEDIHDCDYVKAVAESPLAGVNRGDTVLIRRSDVDVVDLT